MPRILFIIFFLPAIILTSCREQGFSPDDQQAIRTIMSRQQDCWNKGDIECFMEGYWHSDSLRFIGKNGVTHGWENTLERYKKRYPDKNAMGKLTFDIISVEPLGKNLAFVLGKWQLDRETDTLSGHYSLVWKKLNHQWVIIADHSS